MSIIVRKPLTAAALIAVCVISGALAEARSAAEKSYVPRASNLIIPQTRSFAVRPEASAPA